MDTTSATSLALANATLGIASVGKGFHPHQSVVANVTVGGMDKSLVRGRRMFPKIPVWKFPMLC